MSGEDEARLEALEKYFAATSSGFIRVFHDLGGGAGCEEFWAEDLAHDLGLKPKPRPAPWNDPKVCNPDVPVYTDDTSLMLEFRESDDGGEDVAGAEVPGS